MFVRTKIPITYSHQHGKEVSCLTFPKNLEVRLIDIDESGNAVVGIGQIVFLMDQQDLDIWPEEISAMTH